MICHETATDGSRDPYRHVSKRASNESNRSLEQVDSSPRSKAWVCRVRPFGSGKSWDPVELVTCKCVYVPNVSRLGLSF